MKRSIVVLALMAFAFSLAASADIVATKDSSNFAYKYEMDSNPSGQDLDSNSTFDWFWSVAGGSIIPQTYSGGVAQSDQSAGTPENLFRTDFGGSITRANTTSGSPWTIEMRVQKTTGTQGGDGWFGVAMQTPNDTFSTRVNFEDDRVSYRGTGGTNVDHLVGTDFTSGFHTMRIAYEGNDNTDETQQFFVWIDGSLLNDGLTSADAFVGGNGSFNSGGSWYIGDFSSGIAGDWEVDYIRFEDNGAFNVIPEPASIGLIGLVGLVYLLRRKLLRK